MWVHSLGIGSVVTVGRLRMRFDGVREGRALLAMSGDGFVRRLADDGDVPPNRPPDTIRVVLDDWWKGDVVCPDGLMRGFRFTVGPTRTSPAAFLVKAPIHVPVAHLATAFPARTP